MLASLNLSFFNKSVINNTLSLKQPSLLFNNVWKTFHFLYAFHKQLPAPVFDDPMDLGQVINSLVPRRTRMPDTVYKKVAEVFDEAGICRICRDYVASGHQPGSLRRLAGKDNTEKSNYFVLSCAASTALSADDVRSGPRSLSLPLHFAARGVVTALIDTGAQGNLLISQYAVSSLGLPVRRRSRLTLKSFTGQTVERTDTETVPLPFPSLVINLSPRWWWLNL